MVKCQGKLPNGTSCVQELDAEDFFCRKCGFSLASEKDSKFPISVQCPNKVTNGNICGSILTRDDNFCGKCGWRVNENIFLPGARTCNGTIPDGGACKNIVTPTTLFCSGCGKPPESANEECKENNQLDSSSNATCTAQSSAANQNDELSNIAKANGSDDQSETAYASDHSEIAGNHNPSPDQPVPTTEGEEHVETPDTYAIPSVDNEGIKRATDSPPMAQGDSWKCDTYISSKGNVPDVRSGQDSSGSPTSDGSDSSNNNKPEQNPQTKDCSTSVEESAVSATENKTNIDCSKSDSKSMEMLKDDTNGEKQTHPLEPTSIEDNTENNDGDNEGETVESGDEDDSNYEDENSSDDTTDHNENDEGATQQNDKDNENTVPSPGKSKKRKGKHKMRKKSKIKYQKKNATSEKRGKSGVVEISAEQKGATGTDNCTKSEKEKAEFGKKTRDVHKENPDTTQENKDGEKGPPSNQSENQSDKICDADQLKETSESLTNPVGTNRKTESDKPKKNLAGEKGPPSNQSENQSDKICDADQLKETSESLTNPVGTNRKTESDKPKKNLAGEKGPSLNQSEKQGDKICDADQLKETSESLTNPMGTNRKTESDKLRKNSEDGQRSDANRNKKTRYTEGSVDVHFHVLVSPRFKVHAEKDIIGVSFANNLLGGLGQQYKMEFKRSTKKDYLVMECVIQVPVYLLQHPLSYIYFVLPNGKIEEKVPEYFYHHINKGEDELIMRSLSVPHKDVQEGVYHSFDGVMNQKPEERFWISMYRRVTNTYEKELVKDVGTAAKEFFPMEIFERKSDNLNVKNALRHADFLFRGLQKSYFDTTTKWSSERCFKEFLGKILSEIIQEKLIEEATSLSSSIVILILCKKLHMKLPNNQQQKLQSSLLLKADQTTRTSPQYEWLEKQFEQHLPDVQEVIEKILRDASTSDDPSWLYCIPLWHFVTRKCKPFEEIPKDESHDSRKPKWWGTADFNDTVYHFKGKSQWTSSLHTVFQKLQPLFEADYLLPRSFVAILTLERLSKIVPEKKIPPEVTLAAIYFYMKDRRFHCEQGLACLKVAASQLESVMKTMLTGAIPSFSVNQAAIACRVSSDLLRIVMGYYSPVEDIAYIATEIFILTLGIHELMIKRGYEIKSNKKQRQSVRHLTALSERKIDLIRWFKSSFHYYNPLTDLKVWNRVLTVEIGDGAVKQGLYPEMKRALKELVKQADQITVLEIYCKQVETFCKDIQEVLSEVAFKNIEDGHFLNVSDWNINDAKRYGAHLSAMFRRSWRGKDTTTTSTLLHFALSWPPFNHFLKMFYLEKKSELLEGDCVVELTQAATLIEAVSKQVVKGTVMVGDLKSVHQNCKPFIETVNIMRKKDGCNALLSEPVLKCAINLRMKEVEVVERILVEVIRFTNLCQHFPVDIKDLDSQLHLLEKMDDRRIDQICRPGNVDEVRDLSAYSPSVTAFGLTEEVLQALPELLRYSKSSLFMKMWEEVGRIAVKANNGKPLTVENVIENVMNPVSEKWTRICQKIQHGEITFSEFNKYFNKTEDRETLQEEFQKMAVENDDSWIAERLNQIDQHRLIQQCLSGAEVILKVVKEYGLKEENFKKIRLIEELDGGCDLKMKNFDASFIKTCSLLKEMSKEQVETLEMFMKCKDLVKWLRESMSTGLKELKVFVELASISAGEGDMEVAKVKCLHSATTGYAPLIFNMDSDCDCDMFLRNCEVVWRELEADSKLPQKLWDTNRHLEWLKTVKKAHGSVEVTSMTQAEAINSHGIYTVGKMKHELRQQKLTLIDVLELHVSGEDPDGSKLKRKYMYNELQELQSKLMLVAGKAEQGADDVDKFTIILDGVVRLSNVYIKLQEAGCVLFTNWQARFLCDPERTVCAFVRFGLTKACTQLEGRKSDKDDVSTVIPKLAKFMENCLEKWLAYIDDKRNEYYHLNYFTIDQMVILQKELVTFGTDTEPSDLIYPLLSAVKHACTKEDLVAAMSLAKKDVDEIERIREGEIEMSHELEEAVESCDNDNVRAKENFIEEILKAGYSESLARVALQQHSADSIDEAIVWCLEHENDSEDESSDNLQVHHNKNESGESKAFAGWTDTTTSVADRTQEMLSNILYQRPSDMDDDPLIHKLEALWEEFLSSVSSSVSDYLSVEHLGIILKRLAEKDTVQIERRFLPCFSSDTPNLLICPQDDVLNTLLSVYCNDTQQPLPQSDEVLLCTPHTTLDQLDIFWRRSIFDNSNRVHCLVSADQLDYDVSDRGERRLEYHMQKASEQSKSYKLVVICSSEYEYRSRIVAALDKYRCPPLPLTSIRNLRSYIQTKLTEPLKRGKTNPASSVDFENCTARVVKSWRAGVGKTLCKKRMAEELRKQNSGLRRMKEAVVTIPLHERELDLDNVMQVILQNTLPPGHAEPRLFHIDIAHEVQEGVDYFLFQLLILGCLTNSSGYVWRKQPQDLYLIETMPLLARENNFQDGLILCMNKCLNILPDVICRSPQECLNIQHSKKPSDFRESDLLFDEKEFRSQVFQRPFQYLYRLDNGQGLHDIDPNEPEGTQISCLQTLLRHCGMRDPSWAEIHHFVSFLNTQLLNFEGSAFCGKAAEEDLPGFSQFVLKFLIQMSKDFATRSLNMSEESPVQLLQKMNVDEEDKEDEELLQQYQLRRTWESSPHPYLFFNPDHHSMTFLGFNINRNSGDLIDQQTGQVLERGIIQKNLRDALMRNRVNLNENFDSLPRDQKILKLSSVMGVEYPDDPDYTYELTTDNVKKILAIYMRFRCNIPVMIMGETGCGKTRLIKFMCSLQCPAGLEVENMVIMKVHGGTTTADIVKKVHKAEEIAKQNADKYGTQMYTVLFFDEANTTEAIGLIKEIMCDCSMEGKPLKLSGSLKIVAACNPYRKHSEELIKKLEQAGLGYHVDADKTTDRMGRVPLRRLVYRVQPLPQSMLPLVWDFGQLDTQVEKLYIKQMVLRYIRGDRLPDIHGLEVVVSEILRASQEFMREQKDECSFVSLRDVERVLEVMSWFHEQSDGQTRLFELMNRDRGDSEEEEEDYEVEDDDERVPQRKTLNDVTRSLVLALGVCYHACLKNRDEYRKTVCRCFTEPCPLPGGSNQMLEEITRCQEVFLESVELGENIARNQALKENVFMMVVCAELRIPLFLVGKPGSSKSLAKTIVADAMQGNAAHKDLFKCYKQVQMVSYQCSPLSVPEGIVGTFRQCAMYQKDKDLNRFVSVVVLDEVGLAEDSPRMPLKTLHPLLEDGCQGDESPEPHKKVAFIGISNWALDPAKMNRGILVQREVPDLQELTDSAIGICSSEKKVKDRTKHLVEPLAKAYLKMFSNENLKREFFGLRDFYSLLKMIYGFAAKYKKMPSWLMLKHAILRNFGGFESVDPVAIFAKELTSVNKHELETKDDPDTTSAGLIQACLQGEGTENETRYLLLLTENYGALTILQQKILTMNNAITIFGSSFPSDQEYTQVCRNINRIKVCMETGNTVVLLNLENLYESLYDALNQYYVYFGGERYVDLGLGTHRVKCRVHKNFRLIVVAEKEVVYSKFPIPLINRLEKHFLTVSTMLKPAQQQLAQQLEEWAEDFAKVPMPLHRRRDTEEYKVGDVFMGFHADTCAAIVLHVTSEQNTNDSGNYEVEKEVLKSAKEVLLWCATPDAVLRLKSTRLHQEEDKMNGIYFNYQQHGSLMHYLYWKLRTRNVDNLYAQITTHSKLISTSSKRELSNYLDINCDNIALLNLQSFDTEQQFCRKIRNCFESDLMEEKLLIVQCDSGDDNASLVACARYCVQDELHQLGDVREGKTHVVFIIQLPRIAGGCFTGFQCGMWHSLHIDDLRPPDEDMPEITHMIGKSVGTLLDSATKANATKPLETSMEWESTETRSDADHSAMDVDNPVDSEDVLVKDIDFKAVQQPIYKCFDMGKLIKLCVQPALAMVKDSDHNSPRTTERVKVLLDLLHQQSTQAPGTFVGGLAKQLTMLMKEKEEKHSYAASDWISVEATKAENINRAGTFRKATIQCLVDKVTPLLAGIVAYIDTNQNLDILSQGEPDGWKHCLWLEIMNNPAASLMDYNLMLSPLREHELVEIIVKGTGNEGHIFSSQMPFSWLIHRQIDRTWHTSKDVDRHGEKLIGEIKRVADVVKDTELGKILKRTLAYNMQDSAKSYLNDFIHMVYPGSSDVEYQLVCECVLNNCKANHHQELEDAVDMFVGFYVTYQHLAPRLKNFAKITREWPECSSKILQLQQTSPQFYLFTEEEMTLDILGLHLMIEDLTPTKEALNEEKDRSQWLRKVHKYRPVVERILGQFVSEYPQEESMSRRCKKGIDTARNLWTRVVVMKLFIENVCTSDDRSLTVKRCMPLWIMLKDDADMKRKDSLEKVERFLRVCNKEAVKHYFGSQQKCQACETEIDDRPIQLPCKDVICKKCYTDIEILQTAECPKCHYDIPEDFNPEDSGQDKVVIQKYNEFKRRCNSFFVEVVSQLCFADNVAPSKEVVEKLLQYVTLSARRGTKTVTKEMTIFDDCIDPTPVVRSYLLQLLLRTSSDYVYEHLSIYFDNAKSFVKDQQDQLIELCLLVIQCLEDSFHQEVSRSEDQAKDEVKKAIQMLNGARDLLIKEGLEVDKLFCLAEARFALSVVAKYLQNLIVRKSVKLDATARRLMSAAGKFCDECGSKWPKLFVVKYLCRCYGIESYQTVCTKSDASILRWITVPELSGNKAVECADRFIVCGAEYSQLREQITKAVLSQDTEQLQECMQRMKVKEEWMKIPLIFLALYREVTMSYVYPENKRRVNTETTAHLQQFLEEEKLIADQKSLVKAICDNLLWRRDPLMNISEGMDMRHQNVVCLIVHVFIVTLNLPGDHSLMEPLIRLATQPENMQAAFLPTMPQDDVAEIKEALLNARGIHGNENPVFYRCPNGHAYIIGDCGRPATVGRCKECGEEIGGEGYKLRRGNIQDQGLDQTSTGHILGRAQNRKPTANPERNLSPAMCAILRLFTHIFMYCGANVNPLAVQSIIKPDIAMEDVLPFLWDHIEVDLECIQRALGKSIDDVLLLLHSIVNTIMTCHQKGENCPSELCALSRKESRIEWEEKFCKRYFSVALQDLENVMRDLNDRLVKDKRLGSDPLLCFLYEANVTTEQTNAEQLHNVPEVWRYRSQITMDHLSQTFLNQVQNPKRHQILRAFLAEEHHLRAIRLIPSIMKLQRMLIQKYQRSLDRAEGTSTTIEDVIRDWDDGRSREVEHLVHDFMEAWECVRHDLQKYVCKVPTKLTVSKEYCRKPITEKSPVSLLLPTHRDAGICSYVLLNFLLEKQNFFLRRYCELRRIGYDTLPKVQVHDVTSAHLISYHPERDILPMVLANCNYSFEVGKGTKIEYNFTDIERQLMDRFLFSKSVISDLDQVETMTYRAETTNAVVFRNLRERIKQEPLAAAVRHKICEEFRSYPDLCDCLDKLDIAVSFLRSVGDDPILRIEKFMSQTLKMENPIPSPKARQSCSCKHVQSLWLTLAMEKTKRSASYRQEVFEGIGEEFRKELTDIQRQQLHDICQDEAADKLELFLEVLFECIMLVISVPQNPDDDDYVDMTKYSLRDVLIVHIDSPQFDTEQQYPDWMSALLQKIPSGEAPEEKVLSEQAVDVWLCLFAVYSLKQKERR